MDTATPRQRSRTASAALLLATLVGLAIPPAALWMLVGWPLPSWPIDVARAVETVQAGLVPSAVWINVLAVAAWTAWAALVGALLVEVVAVVRNRPSSTTTPRWVRQAAQVLVSAALTVSGPAQSAVTTVAPPVAATAVTAVGLDDALLDPMLPDHIPTAAPDGTRLVTVAASDSWAGLAETVLGDADRGAELRELNVGRDVEGDVVKIDTVFVDAGWVLAVPVDATPDVVETRPAPAPRGNDTPTRTADPAGEAVEEMGEWEVEPSDHMWKIAKETLEDELGREPTDDEVTPHWRSIIAANRHNLLPPEDPDLIYPGQVLDVPPINGQASPDPDSSAAPVREPAEQPADHQTDDALDDNQADEVADSPDGTAAAVEDEPATADDEDVGRQDRDGGIVDTGDGGLQGDERDRAVERGGLPGVAGEPSRLAPIRPAPTPSVDVNPSEAPEPAAGAADATRDQDESSVPVPALAGGGLLAAALIAILSHRRWWHARRRKPGTTPPPPPDSAVARMLHAAADPTTVEMAKLVLRDLAAQLDPAEAPPIAAVYLSGRTVNVLFDTAHQEDPPRGWTATDHWEWSRDLDIDDIDDDAAAVATMSPLPALVSVGADGRGGLLLLDLERATVTNIVGDPNDVAATMTALALELAGSDLAPVLEVICVGFGADLADDLLRVRHVDVGDVDQLVDELDNRPYPDGPALGPRLDGWGDTYIPVVVIDPTGSADLAACARQHPAAVLGLVTSGQPGEWTLTLDGVGHVTIDSHVGPLDRWDLDRPDLDLDTVTEIAALLADAGVGDTDHHEELSDTIRANPIDIRSRTADPSDPQVQWPPVVVRLLGEVRIDGTTDRAGRVPSTEMIAYLALHPGATVSLDTMSEMMWPGLPPQTDRMYRISTDARRILGTGTDGQPRMPHANGHGYTVTDEVGTDLAIFEDLVDQAAHLPGAEARAHLRTALDLVKGEPFAGSGTDYAWAQTGPAFTAAITVEQAASSLGELYLDDGDTDAAEWAARQGLKAMPGSERLYAVRLRAAAGDTRRLEMLMREITAVLGIDDGPDSNLTVPDELRQLYRELTRPQQAAI